MIENRTRIILEILASVKSAAGGEYPVLVKMNSEDFTEGGLTREDSLQAAVMIASAGADAIELTDRFTDSTFAYKGYGRGLDLQIIDSMDLLATGRLRPDITLLLDLDVKTGLQRNRGANKKDRLELEDISFHERVRNGYHMIAAQDLGRIKLIRVTADIGETHREITRVISDTIGL